LATVRGRLGSWEAEKLGGWKAIKIGRKEHARGEHIC
jgi:hypothetical protein